MNSKRGTFVEAKIEEPFECMKVVFDKWVHISFGITCKMYLLLGYATNMMRPRKFKVCLGDRRAERVRQTQLKGNLIESRIANKNKGYGMKLRKESM